MTRPDTPSDTLTTEYLERLRRASTDLPDGARADLLDNIETHLAESLGPDAELTQVRTVLDELGTPEQITAAARAESGTRPQRSQAELTYDVVTVLLLLLGGFLVPLLGWIAGVMMLWNGSRWNRAQKWLGTVVWPLTLGAAVLFLLIMRGPFPALLELVLAGIVGLPAFIGFIVAFAYLLRAAARPQRAMPAS